MSPGFIAAWSSSLTLASAGPLVYERGVSYQRDRRVELTEAANSTVRAVVRGTIPYRVTLGVEADRADWSCTCPFGESGAVCKHVVAAVVTVLGGEPTLIGAPGVEPSRSAGAVDLASYVDGLDHDELVRILLAQTETDWRLREQLRSRAAGVAGSPVDEQVWRQRIASAFAPYGDYVDYHQQSDWNHDVDEMLGAIGELIDTHPAQAINLLEYAYDQANESIQWVDGSDGCHGVISSDIADLHLAACEAERPDPIGLAARLVGLELKTTDLDGFKRTAVTYLGVLGPVGLAEFRRLIEPLWDNLGNSEAGGRDYAIREAMLGYALASGDPDEMIRVRGRSLRLPGDYLEIVQSLAGANRAGEAIEWGQRGLVAMADRSWQLPPLREAVAGLLREAGNVRSSVALFEDDYRRSPSLTAYRRLLDEAELVGERDTTREASIRFLRALMDAQPVATRGRPSDLLIEILLFDGQADDAWAVASEHDCVDGLWLSIAEARQDTHPLDAIPIYRRAALTAIDTKNNRGYDTAVAYLSKIRQCAQRADDLSLFTALIVDVRSTHKPKRNLMALLERKRW